MNKILNLFCLGVLLMGIMGICAGKTGDKYAAFVKVEGKVVEIFTEKAEGTNQEQYVLKVNYELEGKEKQVNAKTRETELNYNINDKLIVLLNPEDINQVEKVTIPKNLENPYQIFITIGIFFCTFSIMIYIVENTRLRGTELAKTIIGVVFGVGFIWIIWTFPMERSEIPTQIIFSGIVIMFILNTIYNGIKSKVQEDYFFGRPMSDTYNYFIGIKNSKGVKIMLYIDSSIGLGIAFMILFSIGSAHVTTDLMKLGILIIGIKDMIAIGIVLIRFFQKVPSKYEHKLSVEVLDETNLRIKEQSLEMTKANKDRYNIMED